jgi:hypothetical protein
LKKFIVVLALLFIYYFIAYFSVETLLDLFFGGGLFTYPPDRGKQALSLILIWMYFSSFFAILFIKERKKINFSIIVVTILIVILGIWLFIES